jgi:ribosome production factor 2
MLDVVELGIENYKGLKDYAGAPSKAIGSKPMFLFVGDNWESNADHKKLQNLLLDFFKGDPVDKLNLTGLDHIITVTSSSVRDSSADTLFFRTYYVKLKKNPNGSRTPAPLLTPFGPEMDLKIRRTQFASLDIWKAAMKQPKQATAKKVKNIETNAMGETVGRLHLEKQDFGEIGSGKKMRALKKAEEAEKAETAAELDAEAAHEDQTMAKEFGWS